VIIHFVDICEIDHHHCLNLFSNFKIFQTFLSNTTKVRSYVNEAISSKVSKISGRKVPVSMDYMK